MSKQIVLKARGLSKCFCDADSTIEILNDTQLDLAAGESVAIVGASGSGKSTLLHLLGGLDKPDSGVVEVAGVDLFKASRSKLADIRNQHIGFVYQFHHLLMEFSALENVIMPLIIRGENRKQAEERGVYLLEKVGLGKRVKHKPAQLSGGERQRAAIARALVTKPACLLTDEPTGNLDPHTAEQVFAVLKDLVNEENTGCIVVTHDHGLAGGLDRVLSLEEGRLVE